MANVINTRIQLKYDTLKNWQDNNTLLLQGEIACVSIGDVTVDNKGNRVAPPVMMKVGPGNFNDLGWTAAKAADVYAWAKKETPDWNDFPALPITIEDNGTGKFITDITYNNNTITITRADAVNSIAAADKSLVFDKSTGDVKANVNISSNSDNALKLEADGLYVAEVTIPSISITNDTAAETPTGDTVDVYKNLTANGHQLTEELVTVPTKAYVDKEVAAAISKGAVVTGGDAIRIDHAADSTEYEVNVKYENTSAITIFENNTIKPTLKIDNPGNTVTLDIGSNGLYANVNTSNDGNVKFETVTGASSSDPTTIKANVDLSGYQPKGNYKNTQTAVVDPTANGTSLTFIDTIAQNEQGVITATKKTVDLSNYQEKGNYKTVQEAVEETGAANKTLTISQDTNGKITATPVDIAITHEQVTDFDSEVKTLAAEEINRLINAADPEGGKTIADIEALVQYVDENAGEITGLITSVGEANTNASNAVATAGEAKAKAEEALGKANEALTGAEGAQAAKTAAEAARDAAAQSAANASASAEDAERFAGQADASSQAAQGAQAAAVEAQEAAELAQAGAKTAKGLADTAAGQAQGYADEARVQAGAASGSASEAAASAGSAETAQSKAEAAQKAAEDAKAAAEASNTSATAIANEAKGLATTASADATTAKNTVNALDLQASEGTEGMDLTLSGVNKSVHFQNSETITWEYVPGNTSAMGAKVNKAGLGLHEIATTGSIYDVKEGANVSTGTDKVEYLIFNCGSASTII